MRALRQQLFYKRVDTWALFTYAKIIQSADKRERKSGAICGRAMGATLPYIASMTTHAHAALTIQQAIERADAIEQRTQAMPSRAVQSPFDLSDAMRALLVRLSARTGNVASGRLTARHYPRMTNDKRA